MFTDIYDFVTNLMSLQYEYERLAFKENWFSKDGIGEYISALSNGAALCGKEYGYIIWGRTKRSGRGVPKIVNVYGRKSIRIEKNFIVVTIPFNRINVTAFELNVKNEPVNEPVNSVLVLLQAYPDLSKEKIAEKIGKSRSTVTRILAKLVSEGKIKRVGSDKNGHWEVLR